MEDLNNGSYCALLIVWKSFDRVNQCFPINVIHSSQGWLQKCFEVDLLIEVH